jgi:hypothetical protein
MVGVRRVHGALLVALGCTILSSARDARAASVTFNTDYEPNVINLWSSSPFLFPSGGGASAFTGPSIAGGTHWVADWSASNPGFLQLVLDTSSGKVANAGPSQGLDVSSPAWLTWTQSFQGGALSSSFSLNWQEVYYNTSTGATTGFAGNLSGAGLGPGTYSGPTTSSGSPLFLGPTSAPEPTTFVIFGLALGCMAVTGRSRSRSES